MATGSRIEHQQRLLFEYDSDGARAVLSELKSVEKTTRAVERGIDGLQKTAERGNEKLDKLASIGMANLAANSIQAAQEIGQLVSRIVQAAESGARANSVMSNFTGNVQKLKSASAGIFSETELQQFDIVADKLGATDREIENVLKQIAKLSASGTVEEPARLLKAAIQGTPEAWREVGIAVDFTDEKYKDLSETERKLALFQEIAAKGASVTASEMRGQANEVRSAQAAWADFISSMEQSLATALSESGALPKMEASLKRIQEISASINLEDAFSVSTGVIDNITSIASDLAGIGDTLGGVWDEVAEEVPMTASALEWIGETISDSLNPLGTFVEGWEEAAAAFDHAYTWLTDSEVSLRSGLQGLERDIRANIAAHRDFTDEWSTLEKAIEDTNKQLAEFARRQRKAARMRARDQIPLTPGPDGVPDPRRITFTDDDGGGGRRRQRTGGLDPLANLISDTSEAVSMPGRALTAKNAQDSIETLDRVITENYERWRKENDLIANSFGKVQDSVLDLVGGIRELGVAGAEQIEQQDQLRRAEEARLKAFVDGTRAGLQLAEQATNTFIENEALRAGLLSFIEFAAAAASLAEFNFFSAAQHTIAGAGYAKAAAKGGKSGASGNARASSQGSRRQREVQTRLKPGSIIEPTARRSRAQTSSSMVVIQTFDGRAAGEAAASALNSSARYGVGLEPELLENPRLRGLKSN